MRTALYRHWDKEGQLLYVGISLSAVSRLAQHRTKSHWSQSIANVTIEYHKDRKAAEAAERVAIRKERPLHNIAHAANDNEPEPVAALLHDPEGSARLTVTNLPPLADGDEYIRGHMRAIMYAGSDIPLPPADIRRKNSAGRVMGYYWLKSALERLCKEVGREPFQWVDEQHAIYLASCTNRAA